MRSLLDLSSQMYTAWSFDPQGYIFILIAHYSRSKMRGLRSLLDLTALCHMQFFVMAAPLLFHDERDQIFLKRDEG